MLPLCNCEATTALVNRYYPLMYRLIRNLYENKEEHVREIKFDIVTKRIFSAYYHCKEIHMNCGISQTIL